MLMEQKLMEEITSHKGSFNFSEVKTLKEILAHTDIVEIIHAPSYMYDGHDVQGRMILDKEGRVYFECALGAGFKEVPSLQGVYSSHTFLKTFGKSRWRVIQEIATGNLYRVHCNEELDENRFAEYDMMALEFLLDKKSGRYIRANLPGDPHTGRWYCYEPDGYCPGYCHSKGGAIDFLNTGDY